MVTFGNYKQHDSRWGSKNYNGSSNYATAACGATSVANIVYALDKSVTPVTIGKYMQSHGYAIRNKGTAWAGIPSALKAFGVKDVKQVDKMADVWALMAKGYVGVFLFGAGSRGGICWTTGGHYISVTGYKVKNGKHYLYTRDSGGRNHTGWYCYETQMKGLIPRIWLGDVGLDAPAKTQTTPKNYRLTVDGKWGRNTTITTQHIFKLTEDGVMGKSTWKAIQKKVGAKVDGVAGKETYTKMSKFLGIAKQTKKTKALVKAWQKWCNTQTPPSPTTKPYTGTFPKLPTRGYFKRGDKGTQVKYLQKFLNWYGGYKLVVDGVIGSKTIIAVEKFQKAEGLDVDGLFGKKCLARAKVVKK